MPESLTVLVSLLTAIGAGGVAGSIAQYLADRRKQVQAHHFESKQRRYGAIIILMIARIGPEEDFPKLTRIRPDLQDLDDVIREMDVELLNSFLFASDSVIENLAEFNKSPSRRSLLAVAAAMRSDLYGRSNKVRQSSFEDICRLGAFASGDIDSERLVTASRTA